MTGNGKLIYNFSQEMAISFTLAEFEHLSGLYCGACFDVFIGGYWVPTRIERNATDGDWYLVGLKGVKPAGLPVRV
jgi:hypothetical protein